jgi:hypothetical protein
VDAPVCIVGSLALAGPWVEAHGSTTATRLDHSADLVANSINLVRFDERSQEHQIIFCYNSRMYLCTVARHRPSYSSSTREALSWLYLGYVLKK